MSTYIDTSAIVAILDANHARHAKAAGTWEQLLGSEEQIVISSYAIVETAAVLQARYEAAALRAFLEDMLPAMIVYWVDANLHAPSAARLLEHPGKNSPSLVDYTAFEIIRQCKLDKAFAYDKHFENQGFVLVGQEV